MFTLDLRGGQASVSSPFSLRATFQNGIELSEGKLGRVKAQKYVEESREIEEKRETPQGISFVFSDRSEYSIQKIGQGIALRWRDLAYSPGDNMLLLKVRVPSQWKWIWSEGYQSWSPLLSFPFGQKQPQPRIALARTVLLSPIKLPKAAYTSPYFLLFSSEGKALLVGFSSANRYFTGVTYQDGAVALIVRSEPPYEQMESEEAVCISGKAPEDVLTAYAERLAENYPTERAQPFSGWCSWYYYFQKITPSKLEENLSACDRLPFPKPFLFQIDDGYQAKVGDWLSSSLEFPDGVASLACKARQKQLLPGLWLAPFVDVKKKLPLLQNPNGKAVRAGINPVWKGNYYGVDLSHPETEHYLESVFRKFYQDGFRYFKLDFLFGALLDGTGFAQEKTKIEYYREMLKNIYGWTEKSLLLGCGAPLLPTMGLVQTMRVSTDVDPRWSHYSSLVTGEEFTLGTRNALLTSARRYFYQKAWRNDPDCVMLRDMDTHLTRKQARSLASFVSFYGGLFLLSDRLRALAPHRQQWLSFLYPPATEDIDIYQEDEQLLILGRRYPNAVLLLLFNKQKEAVEFKLSAKEWIAEQAGVVLTFFGYDCREGETTTVLHIPKESVEIVSLVSSKSPAFLGDKTKVHLCFTSLKESYFDFSLSELYLRFSFQEERVHRLLIYTGGRKLKSATPHFSIHAVSKGVLEARGHLAKEAECVFHFEG